MKNKYIKIFATGGTFDKEFNEINGELYFKETNLYQLLQLGRSQIDVKIETLMMIDSLLMSDEDRQYILDKCLKEKTSKIIITHGTDTMVETAKYIAKHVKDKVVILTGAMIPIKFGSSDGLFNLGSAFNLISDSIQQLRVGFQSGITTRGINTNDITFDAQYNGTQFDPNLPTNENFSNFNHVYGNLNLGVHYMVNFKSQLIQIHASCFNLNQSNQSFHL